MIFLLSLALCSHILVLSQRTLHNYPKLLIMNLSQAYFSSEYLPSCGLSMYKQSARDLLYRSEAPQRLAQKACRAQWRARELGSLLSKRLGSSDHGAAYERVIASGPKESMELVFGLRGDA